MRIHRLSCAFALLLLVGLAQPAAFAHSVGGGGHAGGSMGHGGHASIGSRAGFAPHAGGFRGYAGAPHVAMQHYASRSFAPARAASFAAPTRAGLAHWSAGSAAAGRGVTSAAGFRGRGYGLGYARGYAHWGGGYWGGRFWPAAYYAPGFAWFLPVLPYYTTYWWEGVPYYYYNDIYYTWSPTANGYVATDPPPAAPSNAPSDGPYDDDQGAGPSAVPEAAPEPIPPGEFTAGINHVNAYPLNGQSEQQQAGDRLQCDQWAASQAGSAASGDYRRADIACLQGRGYSAQ